MLPDSRFVRTPCIFDIHIIILILFVHPAFTSFDIITHIFDIHLSKHKMSELRFRFTMILDDYRKESGEDLYELIQDHSFSTWVTEAEYREVTGVKHLPPGYGRSGGGKRKKISDGGGAHKYIQLPPQEFNWGSIDGPENREWRNQGS